MRCFLPRGATPPPSGPSPADVAATSASAPAASIAASAPAASIAAVAPAASTSPASALSTPPWMQPPLSGSFDVVEWRGDFYERTWVPTDEWSWREASWWWSWSSGGWETSGADGWVVREGGYWSYSWLPSGPSPSGASPAAQPSGPSPAAASPAAASAQPSGPSPAAAAAQPSGPSSAAARAQTLPQVRRTPLPGAALAPVAGETPFITALRNCDIDGVEDENATLTPVRTCAHLRKPIFENFSWETYVRT